MAGRKRAPSTRAPSTRAPSTPDLFEAAGVEPAVAMPAGFVYRPDLFSEADERRYVAQFESLPFKPFEFHGYLGNRRVVSFGFGYDYSAEELRDADPIPEFLGPLRDIAGTLSGVPADRLVQALITEYAPGAGIGWHRDRPMYEDIIALSFVSPCTLRFRQREGSAWLRRSLEVAPRSGYMLRGEAREAWEHSIPAVDRLRYSVTFRNFRAA
jgi:alkylated DNA repair dioxygenase AlkB